MINKAPTSQWGIWRFLKNCLNNKRNVKQIVWEQQLWVNLPNLWPCVRVSLTHPWAFLQLGHHDDVSAALLPDHPPEIAEGLRQRTLSGDVCVLFPVTVDVVGVDVVAPWNACAGKMGLAGWLSSSRISAGIEFWFRFTFLCRLFGTHNQCSFWIRVISWLLTLNWRVKEWVLIEWHLW